MGTEHDINNVQEKEFSDLAGWPALDFVNTVSGYVVGNLHGDMFDDYADLVGWARVHAMIGEAEALRLLKTAAKRPGKAKEALERGRALRMAIYRVFTAVSAGLSPERAALDALNAEVAAAMQNARIEPSGEGYAWGWRNFGSELDSVLWPVAKSAADLLASHKLERVSACQGETCGWLFLDTSKNHSRRWCSMSDCGNTAKARRHYHRKTKGEPLAV
jgi:predicted RNA-binding Zn ribbon-like protein